MSLTLLDAALRGTVFALLLLAAMLWRDRPRLPAARAGLALALGLCVQVIGAAPRFEATVPRLWQAPLVAVSVGNAVLFWIFVQALFDDDFRFRRWHGAAWLAVAALSGLNCAVLGDSGSPLGAVTGGLQRAVPLVFAVLAATAAAAQWRSDLVEGRRRLRAFILLTGVAYSLAMLTLRVASPQGQLSAAMATLDVALLLLIVAVVAWQALGLTRPGLFAAAPASALPFPARWAGRPAAEPRDMPPACAPPTVPAAAAVPPPPDPADEGLAEALQRAMTVEHAYRSEDLSVASLARRLAVPEYRLRRLINQQLGHRNFNAFVNGFRLDEARAVLADPAQRGRAVLTIALDAGFQSVGPFNRAFKAASGCTPTEFRREKLADS